jgi:hypothetical protein
LRRRLLDRTGPVLIHPDRASEAGIVSVLVQADYDLDQPHRLPTARRPPPDIDQCARLAAGRDVS